MRSTARSPGLASTSIVATIAGAARSRPVHRARSARNADATPGAIGLRIDSDRSSSHLLPARLVVLDGLPQAILERRGRDEAESLTGAAGVECAPWLTVGFRRVPPDLAFESGESHDELHQLADGDLAS